MSNIKFKDSIIIEPSVQEAAKASALDSLRRDKNSRLLVEIDATHSGVLTNHRVYPGKFVQNGYKSFFSKERGGTADFDKPILKHHDLYGDPIGRIVNANFMAFKFGEAFDNDFLSPDQMGSRGSGVVTITAIITDADAIKKIIDSRYLSVSASHTSPVLLCSACGDSIMACPHMPGVKYNVEGDEDEAAGVACYAITGPMTYIECSFVNLPAQPPAKLVNFNWTDSKDSWSKDSIIATQITGKRETVRNLTLSDDDGELSLLSNKHKPVTKKTVIAVSPAVADKLKHVMSSDIPSEPDETSNVHPEDKGDKSAASDVEQNLNKAKDLENKSKDKNMTDSTELDGLKAETKSLKEKLAAADAELSSMKKQVEAKDSHIQRLTTDATNMQTKMSKTLALSLASLRVRLKKPGLDSLDTKEKLDAYVEKLSTRSIDSLQDSLQDLMSEPDQTVETKNIKAADEVVAGDRIDSSVPAKGGKPGDKPVKKPATPARAVDKLSEGLGLGDSK